MTSLAELKDKRDRRIQSDAAELNKVNARVSPAQLQAGTAGDGTGQNRLAELGNTLNTGPNARALARMSETLSGKNAIQAKLAAPNQEPVADDSIGVAAQMRPLAAHSEIALHSRQIAQRAGGDSVAQFAAPTAVDPLQTGFLSLYQDTDSGVRFKKLKQGEFLLKGKIVKWDGAQYTNRQNQPVDLSLLDQAAEPDADVLDVTQGEIGYLENDQGALKSIRSVNASPCVTAIIRDTQSKKTMLAHIHRKNRIDDLIQTAVARFGEDNMSLHVNLVTKTYEDASPEIQAEERERQEVIIQSFQQKALSAFDNLLQEDITVDRTHENVTVSASTGALTHPQDQDVDIERGYIGFRRAQAIEQSWGQAPNDSSKNFAPLRTENIMPSDEPVFQMKAISAGSTAVVQKKGTTPGLASTGVAQLRWIAHDETTLAWDRTDRGLQWFYDRVAGRMRYQILNRGLFEGRTNVLDNEGVSRPYNEWIRAGWFHEQDPQLWEEAGWDLQSPIQVQIEGHDLVLRRNHIYIVGVDHREQDSFVNAMTGLQSDEVVFLDEGYDTSATGLPQNVFALEDKAEKLAAEATYAAFFIQRALLGSGGQADLKEHSDRVLPYAKAVFFEVIQNSELLAKMRELSGSGINDSIGQAVVLAQSDDYTNQYILPVLLSAARALTWFVAQKSQYSGEERETIIDEHEGEGSAGFLPRNFSRIAATGNVFGSGVMRGANARRERAMAGNIRRALSLANAVVVGVGQLHVGNLAALLGGRVSAYNNPEEFYKDNASR